MWPPRGSQYLRSLVGQQWGPKVSNTSQWVTCTSKLRSCKNLPKRDYKRLQLSRLGNEGEDGGGEGGWVARGADEMLVVVIGVTETAAATV